MYTTNSSIQWLRFVFPSTDAMYSSLKKRPEIWLVIRIIGPANSRQIERSCVWPESPGMVTMTHVKFHSFQCVDFNFDL